MQYLVLIYEDEKGFAGQSEAAEYRRALELVKSPAERIHLERRLREVGGSS